MTGIRQAPKLFRRIGCSIKIIEVWQVLVMIAMDEKDRPRGYIAYPADGLVVEQVNPQTQAGQADNEPGKEP